MFKFIPVYLFFLMFSVTLQAQKVEKPKIESTLQVVAYSDHKPNYTKWQNTYTIDKIQHTKDKTIIHFRFVHEYDPLSGITTEAVFYPKGGEYPWYLKDVENGNTYELLEIRNIYRNEKLIKNLVNTAEVRSPALDKQNTIFTCEVHFPRLPETVKSFDLIEGRGKETATNHFNCFAIEHKPANSKDLGSSQDSYRTIQNFNDKYIALPEKNIDEKN
jgi:hypothetical protein